MIGSVSWYPTGFNRGYSVVYFYFWCENRWTVSCTCAGCWGFGHIFSLASRSANWGSMVFHWKVQIHSVTWNKDSDCLNLTLGSPFNLANWRSMVLHYKLRYIQSLWKQAFWLAEPASKVNDPLSCFEISLNMSKSFCSNIWVNDHLYSEIICTM